MPSQFAKEGHEFYSPKVLEFIEKNHDKTVLIIEEDNDERKLQQRILSSLGLDVIATTHSTQRGIELNEKLNPDIIFLNIDYPNYEGFYALKNLCDKNYNYRVIVTTENFWKEELEKYLGIDPLYVIQKPINISEIIDTIELVEKSKSEIEMQITLTDDVVYQIDNLCQKISTTGKEYSFEETLNIIIKYELQKEKIGQILKEIIGDHFADKTDVLERIISQTSMTSLRVKGLA